MDYYLLMITGHIVIEVLKVLKELDRHSFVTCKSHSSLSTLYVKIVQTYKPNEVNTIQYTMSNSN